MCGITGFFGGHRSDSFDAAAVIRSMMAAQTHRGPDDEGTAALAAEGGALRIALDRDIPNAAGYLGFNRLSVRDVSQRGHQPMVSRDGNSALIFNGEIYNADELRERYLADVPFESTGDTEVILRLYERFDFDRTVRLLNGMFAIAIVDASTRTLFLARDRVGIKPLYLFSDESTFAFASEMKSITNSGLVVPQLDIAAYYETVVFSFCHGRTLVKGVRELPPATIMEVSLDTFSCDERTYWRATDVLLSAERIGLAKAQEMLPQVLRDCVRSQMVTDVALGCQLSGGVDSSLITYEMMQNRASLDNDNLHPVGIGVIGSDPKLSEEKWMRHAQQVSGVELRLVQVSDELAIDDWRDAVWHMDMIPAMSSEIGVMELARKAREQLTVLLSGEGADELFAGYDRIVRNVALITQADLGGDVRALAADLNVRSYAGNTYDTDISFAEDQLLFNGDGIDLRVIERCCPGLRRYEQEILAPRLAKIADLRKMGLGLWDLMRVYDLEVRMPALLIRQDKMTMASSIENRVPFLDNNMLEFAFSLAPECLARKVGAKIQGKYVLKEHAAQVFGHNFAYRPKIGFSMPVDRYIRAISEAEWFEPLRIDLESSPVLDAKGVASLLDGMPQMKTFDDSTILLWRLLSLGIFQDEFIAQE
ncbi:asparagine synthase (glutamine-hydrolyzing) [Curtanaerobium respiraculi]|uniref:asparagine synthase (glutamine-hydrolyzing) n=1 Tax=Curtanaerobium respiraculi TaxID=2949669 RepID=UPI0024B39D3A|nr:asparagine synthase (glutamine-hydrolyzing) [Curtanaerobium respiraculi]